MLTESKLCDDLTKTLRLRLNGYLVIKHHDPITSGVPDISVTGRRKTSWIEVKYKNPRIIDRAAQRANMKKLARASFFAAYVIYDATTDLTRIERPDGGLITSFSGFDHKAVAEFIAFIHGETTCSST